MRSKIKNQKFKIILALCGILPICALGCDKSPSPQPSPPPPTKPEVVATPTPSSPIPNPTTDPNPPPPEGPASGPRWTSKETTFDCGIMWAGSIRQHRFEFVNSGTELLEIYEAKPACFCSKAINLSTRVMPAKAGQMTFQLDTSGKLGPLDESITLLTNDPVRPSILFRMTADVRLIADQEVVYDSSLPSGGDPKSLEPLRKKLATWEKIDPSQPLKRILRIRNTSGQPLALDLQPLVPEKSPFRAELKETKPGDEFELTILGQPPFKGGMNKAIISMKTNIAGMPVITVPIYATVPQRIEIVPTKIVVDPGMPVVLDRRITITHDGSRPFKITGLSTTEQSFDLRLLPQNPTRPNEWKATLRLPDARYRPPPFGEIVRFETTDSEQPIIDIYVLPMSGIEPGERPESVPTVFQPGIMPPP